ncbi:2058_t:CDS:2, partial [Diversispora eburnea]
MAPIKKDDVHVGQKVRYHPVGGGMQLTEGIVKEIVTHPEIVGDTQKRVKASEEEPRIVIENLHTHKETASRLVDMAIKEQRGNKLSSKNLYLDLVKIYGSIFKLELDPNKQKLALAKYQEYNTRLQQLQSQQQKQQLN